MDIKDLLYQSIDAIGRNKIRTDINSDLRLSIGYIEKITLDCIEKLGPDSNEENLSTLCEALLHFMLAASGLPSERKVSHKGVDLDIVIPSLKQLEKDDTKVLIIQIIKENGEIQKKIADASRMQKSHKNVWIVSANPKNVEDFKNYSLQQTKSYSSIISDIGSFLKENNVRSLRFVSG